ncbi:MAG: tRNA lysidine(34) synthetase TilS, partial [Myxococcaceae bacterium]
MALLGCANALRWNAEIASFDHGLRPEAQAEVDAVRAIAERLGVPFHAQRLALKAGPGMEARARTLRYQTLEEIRQARGLQWIATAHTQTDQAETVLMRLSRGASLKGAGGILKRRGRVIRPLLFASRADVLDYVRALRWVAADDPMNADPQFLRVRIRHDVLPALERAAGAYAVERLAAFAPLAAEDDAYLSLLAGEAFARLSLYEGALDAVGVSALPRPVRRRVVAELLRQNHLDENLLERALTRIEQGGTETLDQGWTLQTQAGVVRCVRHDSRVRQPVELRLLAPDGALAQDTDSGLLFRWQVNAPMAEARELSVGLGPVEGPLTIRRRRAGDRVEHRKLQDALVDAGVPRELRDSIPVVADASGKIVWAVGV